MYLIIIENLISVLEVKKNRD